MARGIGTGDTTLLARFKGFGGGEYGSLGGSNAAHNQFTGRNVIVTRDGAIRPRAGLAALSFTGWPAGDFAHDAGWIVADIVDMNTVGSTGKLWMLADGFASGNSQVYATGANAVRVGTALPLTGVGAPFVTKRTGLNTHWNVSGSLTYLSENTAGVGMAKVDFAANTEAHPATSPSGTCIARFGDRMYIGGASSVPNRVFYSNVANYDSWSASNYFDLPHADLIVAMVPQRNHLVIFQSDMTTYVFSGTPGVNDTLREVTAWSETVPVTGQISSATTPGASGQTATPKGFVRTHNGDIWTVSAGRDCMPAMFNGTALQRVERLSGILADYPWLNGGVTGTAGLGPDDVALGAGPDLLMRTRGTWTAHTFGGMSFPHYFGGPQGVMFVRESVQVAGANPVVAAWDADRAVGNGLASGDWAPDEDFGVLVDAHFTTAEVLYQMPPRYGQVLLRGPTHIEVAFTSYRTGSAHHNHFDVTVNPIQQPSLDNPPPLTTSTTNTATFDEAASLSSVAGTARMVRLSFDAVPCYGFSLTFSNLVGVAIEDVWCLAESIDPDRVA